MTQARLAQLTACGSGDLSSKTVEVGLKESYKWDSSIVLDFLNPTSQLRRTDVGFPKPRTMAKLRHFVQNGTPLEDQTEGYHWNSERLPGIGSFCKHALKY